MVVHRELVWIGDALVTVHLLIATLCYSRRTAEWLDGIAAAFRRFGGVTQVLLCDRSRCLVPETDRATGAAVFTPALLQFCRDWSLSPRACAPYRARTKGADPRHDPRAAARAVRARRARRAAAARRRTPAPPAHRATARRQRRVRRRRHGSLRRAASPGARSRRGVDRRRRRARAPRRRPVRAQRTARGARPQSRRLRAVVDGGAT